MINLSRLLRRVMHGLLLGAGAGLRLWGQATATASPVAARDLPRGAVIALADLRADSAVQAERLLGWEVRRLMRAGEPVREPAVAPPTLVTAGATVAIEAVVAGDRVTRAATALGRGTLGDRITVRLDVHRTLPAVVTGPGLVRLISGTSR